MPPPGVLPPGYNNDHIPPSFMQKRPVPAGADTNTRAYAIFFSYLGLCILLTLFVIQKLFKSYNVLSKSTTARPPPRKHVLLFAGLATASLLTTWHHMIEYFKLSYEQWLMWRSYYELSPEHNHWGLWLNQTSLFKEAWEIAIVGVSRYWWTHQIFFFACALGLALEQKGVRRGITHTWVFMVIGQIVAISFATNLFLLALLLSPPAPPSPSTSAARRKWLGPWIVNFFAIIATEVPVYMLADEKYWHTEPFLPVLLVPHLALLVLPFARALLPAKYLADDDVEFVNGIYKWLWNITIFGGAFLWLKTFGAAYRYSGIKGMFNALTEHPAVSSVGFDVIFCWVTWVFWSTLQKQGANNVFELEKESDEDSWEGAGSGTTVGGGDLDGAIRRR